MSNEDATLLDIFVGEAVEYLAMLERPAISGEAKHNSLMSLQQAAELLIDDALAARAKALLAALEHGKARADQLTELVREIREQAAELRRNAPKDAAEASLGDSAFNTGEYRTLRSFFRDEAQEGLEAITRLLMQAGDDGPDTAAIDELMRSTHTLKGSAGTVGLKKVAEACHRLEDAFAFARDQNAWSPPLIEKYVDAVDAIRAYVDVIEDPLVSTDVIARMQNELDQLDALTRGKPIDKRAGSEPALAIPSTVSEVATVPVERPAEMPVLRVEPARVDRLMDSVGELVFDRTRIERRVQELQHVAADLGTTRLSLSNELAGLSNTDSAETRDVFASRVAELEADLAQQLTSLRRSTAALVTDTDALRRTATSLQDGLTGIRMQSVRSLFQRLAPQLRDIARTAGRRVKLFTAGGETEFDRSVAEQIMDPLVQLLRNALAHGIEPPDVRRDRGKPETGRITITARHVGDVVIIEVADDGAGIDCEALRRRFVESGRWSETRAKLASDDEVLRAIFEAGTSSRDSADELAGRGVGLSSVRTTIARLGGELTVDSRLGKGTTFSMRLPLTTAVTNALLFKVGGHVYAVPNVHVLETSMVEASSPTIPSHVRIQNEPVPLILLHEVLGAEIPGDVRKISAVVIEYLGQRLAMTCDKIVGPREIVLKNLGALLAPLPLYAGATISGSGKVQLILDPAALVRIAYPQQEPAPLPARPTEMISAPRRVLIVDDSRAIRETMTRILERAGYVVETADNGANAWKLLCEIEYDLIVTDLEMPELDGFALIEKIRDDEELKRLPVLVISSRNSDEERARATALAVGGYLAKPVTPRILVEALEQLR